MSDDEEITELERIKRRFDFDGRVSDNSYLITKSVPKVPRKDVIKAVSATVDEGYEERFNRQ